MNKAKWLKAAGIVLLAAGGAWLVHRLFFTRQGIRFTHIGMHQLSDYLKALGAPGQVLGALLVFVQTIVPFVPFVFVAGINVIIYPSPWGFVVNYIMACLAATAAFLFARYYGHDRVMRRVQQYPLAVQFNKQMEKNGFFYVLIGRLIPVMPSSLINLGAGVTKISVRQFVLATWLGKFPMVFLESKITQYLLHFKQYRGRLLLLLALLAALTAVGNLFRKKLVSRRDD
jgi:uncharacterized membrane protein YdjX (TVP38/TMEM64 family)